jgi:rhomboid-like protein
MSEFKFQRPDNFPPIVKNLIIINVLIFVAQLTLGSQLQITQRISLYPIMPQQLQDILMRSGFYKDFEKFQPYQIATHMFAHSPQLIFHIIFNMLALWMFGKILENEWGSKRFLLFYLICGVGAAICHLTIQYFRCESLLQVITANPDNPQISSMLGAAAPALGASGAVMGIFAAFAYLHPNSTLFIMPIPFPVKAKWAVLGLMAIDLFGGIAGSDNIAHFAHLGGALTGFIIVLIWNKTNRKTFY